MYLSHITAASRLGGLLTLKIVVLKHGVGDHSCRGKKQGPCQQNKALLFLSGKSAYSRRLCSGKIHSQNKTKWTYIKNYIYTIVLHVLVLYRGF